ncbi:NnrS family protein [Pseudothauera rhizosphaerae]|uniref:NnrS family protein n=1 Tax=Pseudothauera rhizosphaerae TaxID=2565932 RepID=A0A4V6RX71_9RHOO|nr:NnrS family protein [Pseudothauera rhizosphaerae]THF64126.1 NnrS family protein [Pseudothauera rhizosphaerae]
MSARPDGARRTTLRGRPVFMCGFRPFFVLAAGGAVLFMALWLLALGGRLPAWQPPGGIVLWHAHELVFGFAAAAVAGFTLTAIPEFTRTAPIPPRPLARLALLWLAARLAYALAGWWPAPLGMWPAALGSLALWALLLARIAPPVWRDPERAHLGFAWTMGALALLQAGFFAALAREGDALAWLHAAIGVLAMLIVIATSRVSMSVVNGYMEAGRPGAPAARAVYLARPPRRHLAIFAIGMCTAVEFALGDDVVTGWTALAAATAMLNLLNDWHVGRPLFTRWALMLYASYWLIALGYGLLGAAWLGAPLAPSAGRHLLAAGAVALSIFAIMAMVGRIHAGLWLDRRPWLPAAAAALAAAALLRAWAGTWAAASSAPLLLTASGLLWAGAFAAYLWHAWPVLTGPRQDGRDGCAEPPEGGGPHAGERPC